MRLFVPFVAHLVVLPNRPHELVETLIHVNPGFRRCFQLSCAELSRQVEALYAA